MTNCENEKGRPDAETQLDATLRALNEVQPPARLEQRIHARLAQETANSSSTWFERAMAAWSWPRTAFATATFAAGAVTAVLVMPYMHRPAVVVTQPPSPKTADVHPAFTVQTPSGRVAAVNSASTVAAVRSRKEHSDVQLAKNKSREKNDAKLVKPKKPSAALPVATGPDASSAPVPAQQ